MPTDAVFDAVERLHAELGAVRAVLADPERTSVRLVLTPEAVVVAEARRTMTTLAAPFSFADEASLAADTVRPPCISIARIALGSRQSPLPAMSSRLQCGRVWT